MNETGGHVAPYDGSDPEATVEPGKALVTAVDQLRAALRSAGLWELEAKLAGDFWLMRSDDRTAVLAEVSAELQSRVPERHRGTGAATGVAFDRTPWIAFAGETRAVEDWLSMPKVIPPSRRFEPPSTTDMFDSGQSRGANFSDGLGRQAPRDA